MRNFVSALIVLFVGTLSQAQVIYTQPEFPSQLDDVTVFFDATQGNAGLQGFTGDVYAHTGVITSSSSGPADWKYVQGQWGTTNAPLMTRVSADLYSLDINIQDFYSVPAGEQVLQLAFVFRSADGTESGRLIYSS